jgi:hypothetical protein
MKYPDLVGRWFIEASIFLRLAYSSFCGCHVPEIPRSSHRVVSNNLVNYKSLDASRGSVFRMQLL